MTYRSLLLSYFNIDTISYQGVLLSTVIVEPSHVVAHTHSTIQDGWTALKTASSNGHHKVVELLLDAGANTDLQNKVRTLVNFKGGHCVSHVLQCLAGIHKCVHNSWKRRAEYLCRSFVIVHTERSQ